MELSKEIPGEFFKRIPRRIPTVFSDKASKGTFKYLPRRLLGETHKEISEGDSGEIS